MSVAVLLEAALEGKPLGVIGEGDEAGFAVAVVAHQHGHDAAGLQDVAAMAEQQRVALQERVQRRRARQVARIVGVELLPPVGRMQPDEVEAASFERADSPKKFVGSQASKPWWMSPEMQAMPSSRHTSRQVPLPVIGSKTVCGLKYRSRSLMRLPPQLPG